MSSHRSDVKDYVLWKHAESAKAYKVSELGDEEEAFWLPKSQVEEGEPMGGGRVYSVPDWLAREKGLAEI